MLKGRDTVNLNDNAKHNNIALKIRNYTTRAFIKHLYFLIMRVYISR